jgi:hypothetical protein
MSNIYKEIKSGISMRKLNNGSYLTNKQQHRLGCHKEQPLLFSLVHLILCYAQFEG